MLFSIKDKMNFNELELANQRKRKEDKDLFTNYYSLLDLR